MKIALAQMRVRQGMLERNYQNMVLFSERAKALGAELIAFPEMCLTGDKRTEEDFNGLLYHYKAKIAELSKNLGIIIVYGNNAASAENNIPRYYVNRVGTQNNGKTITVFDGGSCIYGKNGEISACSLNPYEEGLLFSDGFTAIGENYGIKYSGSTLSPIEKKFLAVREAYKSMDEMLGNPKCVFGLSGGIDSVLNMVLCFLALGKDKILAYNLPTVYNSQATKQAAAKVCSNLGISLNTIAIDNILKEFELSLCRDCQGDVATDINVSCYVPLTASVPLTLDSVTRENLQSRIRMAILMAQTSRENAVLINNTNKVELALGYGTLYGDLAGAWCPLGDLLKTEIWEMARFINEKFGQIIPQELIPDENLRFSENQIYPSAELKENQIDPMIWGFDDWLLEQFAEYKGQTPEKILRLHKDGALKELCAKYNLENANDFTSHCEWFFDKLYTNAFKRIQSPPVLVLSKYAFAGDCRESQNKYEWT